MSDGRLILPLEECRDRFDNKYYVAKLKGPFTINCNEGVCFVIFTSSLGEEELQISNITTPRDKEKNDRK